ncbi:MAG UNVERIFIED_CONTAM: hypothetical protein LVT10_17680 [Anaerolineae bacterium]|jgi:hypothetical protein
MKWKQKQFLHWAAQLHELGHDIAHSQYHKHSAYVIEHGDLAGFSRQDQDDFEQPLCVRIDVSFTTEIICAFACAFGT